MKTTKSGFSKSKKKFIRLEKARIRRQFLDIKKQKELIAELYGKPASEANVAGEPVDNTSIIKAKAPISKPQVKSKSKVQKKPKVKQKSAKKK